MSSNPSFGTFGLLSEGILEVICSFLSPTLSLRLISSSFDRAIRLLHQNSSLSNSFANIWANAGLHLEEMQARRRRIPWMKHWKIAANGLSTFFLSSSASSSAASSSSSARQIMSPEGRLNLIKSCFGTLPGDEHGLFGLLIDVKHGSLSVLDVLVQSVHACSSSLSRLRICATDLHYSGHLMQLMNIPSLSSLSSLELLQTNLDSDDVSLLSSLLPTFTNLTHLSLGSLSSTKYRNQISKRGLKSLLPSLASSKIISLNLSEIWNRDDSWNRSDGPHSIGPLSFDFLLDTLDTYVNLVDLNLSKCVLGRDGALSLSECSQLLFQLRHLSVRECSINTEGVVFLLNSSYLPELVTLDMGCNHISGPNFVSGLKHLTPKLHSLKSLTIDHCYDLNPEGIKTLSNCPFMSQLTSLNVAANHIGPSGFHALSSSPSCSRLEVLICSLNEIGDKAAECVANSKYFSPDLHLDLSTNMITASGLKRLSTSPLFPRMTFSWNSQIGAGGMRVLSTLRTVAFDTLDLSGCLIGDEGLELLCSDVSCLANVRRLVLQWNYLSQGGLKALTKSSLKRLIHLDVSHNRLDDEAARYLIELPACLESLDVSNNRITQAGMDALSSCGSLRRTRIFFDDSHREEEPLLQFRLFFPHLQQ